MDFSQLREQLYQLWITVVISIAGAFVGMLLAFFSALAISSKTSRYRVLKYLVRALASLTRNIPEAVWAVLLLPLLWYGDFSRLPRLVYYLLWLFNPFLCGFH